MWKPEARTVVLKRSALHAAGQITRSPDRLTRHKDGNFPEVHIDIRDHRFIQPKRSTKFAKLWLKPVKCPKITKPGAAKATNMINLAQRFALLGYRVLVLHLDPQASLTTVFGYRPELDFSNGRTIYDAL